MKYIIITKGLSRASKTEKGHLPMKEINGTRLYDINDLSELLETSTKTIAKYLQNGTIKGVKIAHKWYTTEENLQEYIKGNTPTSEELAFLYNKLTPENKTLFRQKLAELLAEQNEE